MSFATFASSHITLKNDRIGADDALRQERAAAEVLTRFTARPGVVLADEVGMGKTFVAMAVAVSILLERPTSDPIVVMSPSSLREKWPKDWDVFREKCLAPSLRDQLRSASADSGIELLRLLDDPVERRNHLIFLTHGALNRSISDGFAKLALIKRAFKGRSSLTAHRDSFYKYAGSILRLDWVEARAEGLLGTLLDRPYDTWLRTIHRANTRLREKITDDPVPAHLAEVLDEMEGKEIEEVVEALRQLPRRDSANLEDRLIEARRAISAAMDDVWRTALRRARFASPLLILDEAHHVKNPGTRLASLFASEESAKDSEYFESAGPLGGKFERMLFLTATPFQLGHAEVIRVLERFEGIDWKSNRRPTLTRDGCLKELEQLGRTLDDAQAAALRLDRTWGRLNATHLDQDGTFDDLEQWWTSVQAQTEGEGLLPQVIQQVARTREAMRRAETELSPWVLRHVKPAHMADRPDIVRRQLATGAAIRDGGSLTSGLEIPEPVLLPFLLAGRAQGLLAASSRGRALFAEGLASSFEAYLETRSGSEALDEDEDPTDPKAPPELEWYLKRLDLALPKSSRDLRSAHPKVRATAERAVALWSAGEKVLIFCHYRATGRALRQHVSQLLHNEIVRLGREKLPQCSDEEVVKRLDDLGEQFFNDETLKGAVSGWLGDVLEPFTGLSVEERTQVIDVVRRFVRTPSFLARYLPLDDTQMASCFVAAAETAGAGRPSLRQQIEHFVRFLSERCIESEREQFLAALDGIQTGTHFGKDVRATFDKSEIGARDPAAMLLPNVRLANGEVRHETRRRLLLTFNTPLFPEILIASSVMAEGVDLHLNCRYVIHHDLCWNPSTLEQRSGRVDRIGCKAERVGEPIHLFMPYVAATQDEKMFRVVRDRERWFQIIMGEKYEVDEAATDKRAERIPLPAALQRDLSMRLHP